MVTQTEEVIEYVTEVDFQLVTESTILDDLVLTTERVAEAIWEEEEIATTQIPVPESESQEDSSIESSMEEREQDIQTTGPGNMEAVTEISEDEQTEIVTEIVTADLLPESDRTAAPERVDGHVQVYVHIDQSPIQQ